MKKILSVLIIVAVGVVFSFPVSFCDVYAASKVKLSKTKLSMYIGDSKTIKVYGTEKKVKWSSSKKSVASVTGKGKITAKTKGSATVKAKIGKTVLSCKVTVKDIKLSKTKLSMYIGDSKTIKVTGNKKNVKWSSSQKSVASVTSKGKITARTKGSATVKAKIGKKVLSCKVTVKNRTTNVTYDENLIKSELSTEKDYTINTDSNGKAISVSVPKDDITRKLEKGDVISLPANDKTNGIAMKISGISQSGDSYVFKGSSPKMNEVFDRVDIGKTIKPDMSKMIFSKDIVSGSYFAADSGNGSHASSTEEGDKITLELINQKIGKSGKLKGSISFYAPVITADIDINFFGGNNVTKCNVDVQNKAVANVELEAASKDVIDPLYIGSINSVPLGGNFYVDLVFYLVLEADGTAVVKCTVKNNTGFKYYGGLDIRPYCDFSKSFDGTKAEIDAKLLADPVIAVRWGGWWNAVTNDADWALPIVDMETQFGAGLNASARTYDTPPNICADLTVYAYAKLGIKTNDGIGWIIAQCGGDTGWVLLDKDSENALKVSYHIEDWNVVPKCTHEEKKQEAGMYSLEVNKTYNKYDITGDGKADAIRINAQKYSKEDSDERITSFKLVINGDEINLEGTEKQINSHWNGVYPRAELIQLSCGQPILYVHFSTSDGYHSGGWIYEYKSKKMGLLLDTEKIIDRYAKAYPDGWRYGEYLKSVEDNSLAFNIYSFTTDTIVYWYEYKNGKLIPAN